MCARIDVQLRQSSHEKESEFKKVNLQLQQSLQSCQNELKETEQLLELARRSHCLPSLSVWLLSTASLTVMCFHAYGSLGL